jgi:hypothetical protein
VLAATGCPLGLSLRQSYAQLQPRLGNRCIRASSCTTAYTTIGTSHSNATIHAEVVGFLCSSQRPEGLLLCLESGKLEFVQVGASGGAYSSVLCQSACKHGMLAGSWWGLH